MLVCAPATTSLQRALSIASAAAVHCSDPSQALLLLRLLLLLLLLLGTPARQPATGT
jgi:hypothetical protein